MAEALLAAAQLIGLLLIPLGLPGIWLQVISLVVYAWVGSFAAVGFLPLMVVVLIAIVAEILEFALGARYASRYGGGRRAAVGAIVGGLVGGTVGSVPVPVIGSVIGAFLGAFLGAALLQFTTDRRATPALRTGWGALLGRFFGTAAKGAAGIVIAVVALLAIVR